MRIAVSREQTVAATINLILPAAIRRLSSRCLFLTKGMLSFMLRSPYRARGGRPKGGAAGLEPARGLSAQPGPVGHFDLSGLIPPWSTPHVTRCVSRLPEESDASWWESLVGANTGEAGKLLSGLEVHDVSCPSGTGMSDFQYKLGNVYTGDACALQREEAESRARGNKHLKNL